MVGETKVLRHLQAILDKVDSNELAGAQCLCQHESGETHRAQPDHQNGVISRHADLFESFIEGTETARHLGAIRYESIVAFI